MKKFRILSENFQFAVVKFSIYLNRLVFVMLTRPSYIQNLLYHQLAKNGDPEQPVRLTTLICVLAVRIYVKTFFIMVVETYKKKT